MKSRRRVSRARASSTRRRVGGCAGRLNASGRWDPSPRRGFFIFFYSFFFFRDCATRVRRANLAGLNSRNRDMCGWCDGLYARDWWRGLSRGGFRIRASVRWCALSVGWIFLDFFFFRGKDILRFLEAKSFFVYLSFSFFFNTSIVRSRNFWNSDEIIWDVARGFVAAGKIGGWVFFYLRAYLVAPKNYMESREKSMQTRW